MFGWVKDKFDDIAFEVEMKTSRIKAELEVASQEFSQLTDDFKSIPNDAWNGVAIESNLRELNPKFSSIYKSIIFCHLQDFKEVNIDIGGGSQHRSLSVETAELRSQLKVTRTCSLNISTTKDGKDCYVEMKIKKVTNSKKLELLNLAHENSWLESDTYNVLHQAYKNRKKYEKVDKNDIDSYSEALIRGFISDEDIKEMTNQLIDSSVVIE